MVWAVSLKVVLGVAIALVAITTGLIGFLPTYFEGINTATTSIILVRKTAVGLVVERTTAFFAYPMRTLLALEAMANNSQFSITSIPPSTTVTRDVYTQLMFDTVLKDPNGGIRTFAIYIPSVEYFGFCDAEGLPGVYEGQYAVHFEKGLYTIIFATPEGKAGLTFPYTTGSYSDLMGYDGYGQVASLPYNRRWTPRLVTGVKSLNVVAGFHLPDKLNASALDAVVQFDISTAKITTFLENLGLGNNYRALIVHRGSGKVLGNSFSTSEPAVWVEMIDPTTSKVHSTTISSYKDPTVREFVEFMGGEQEFYSRPVPFSVTNEKSKEDHIFYDVVPIQDGVGLDLLLILMIRERDFMGGIYTSRSIVIGCVVSAVVLMAIFGVVFAFGISRPIERIARHMHLTAQLQEDAGLENETSRLVEVKRMLQSYSRMRDQLFLMKRFLPPSVLTDLGMGVHNTDSDDMDEDRKAALLMADGVPIDADYEDAVFEGIGLDASEAGGLGRFIHLNDDIEMSGFIYSASSPAARGGGGGGRSRQVSLRRVESMGGAGPPLPPLSSSGPTSRPRTVARTALGANSQQQAGAASTVRGGNDPTVVSNTQSYGADRDNMSHSMNYTNNDMTTVASRARRAAGYGRVRQLNLAPSLATRRIAVVCFNVSGWHDFVRRQSSSEGGMINYSHALNRYIDGVSRRVIENKGLVDMFQGDHVVATFNAVSPLNTYARRSVLCALDVHRDFASGKGMALPLAGNAGAVVGGGVSRASGRGSVARGSVAASTSALTRTQSNKSTPKKAKNRQHNTSDNNTSQRGGEKERLRDADSDRASSLASNSSAPPPTLHVTAGVAVGTAIVGNAGTVDMMRFTITGQCYSEASALERFGRSFRHGCPRPPPGRSEFCPTPDAAIMHTTPYTLTPVIVSGSVLHETENDFIYQFIDIVEMSRMSEARRRRGIIASAERPLRTGVTSADEWMYALDTMAAANPYEPVNNAFRSLLKGDTLPSDILTQMELEISERGNTANDAINIPPGLTSADLAAAGVGTLLSPNLPSQPLPPPRGPSFLLSSPLPNPSMSGGLVASANGAAASRRGTFLDSGTNPISAFPKPDAVGGTLAPSESILRQSYLTAGNQPSSVANIENSIYRNAINIINTNVGEGRREERGATLGPHPSHVLTQTTDNSDNSTMTMSNALRVPSVPNPSSLASKRGGGGEFGGAAGGDSVFHFNLGTQLSLQQHNAASTSRTTSTHHNNTVSLQAGQSALQSAAGSTSASVPTNLTSLGGTINASPAVGISSDTMGLGQSDANTASTNPNTIGHFLGAAGGGIILPHAGGLARHPSYYTTANNINASISNAGSMYVANSSHRAHSGNGVVFQSNTTTTTNTNNNNSNNTNNTNNTAIGVGVIGGSGGGGTIIVSGSPISHHLIMGAPQQLVQPPVNVTGMGAGTPFLAGLALPPSELMSHFAAGLFPGSPHPQNTIMNNPSSTLQYYGGSTPAVLSQTNSAETATLGSASRGGIRGTAHDALTHTLPGGSAALRRRDGEGNLSSEEEGGTSVFVSMLPGRERGPQANLSDFDNSISRARGAGSAMIADRASPIPTPLPTAQAERIASDPPTAHEKEAPESRRMTNDQLRNGVSQSELGEEETAEVNTLNLVVNANGCDGDSVFVLGPVDEEDDGSRKSSIEPPSFPTRVRASTNGPAPEDEQERDKNHNESEVRHVVGIDEVADFVSSRSASVEGRLLLLRDESKARDKPSSTRSHEHANQTATSSAAGGHTLSQLGHFKASKFAGSESLLAKSGNPATSSGATGGGLTATTEISNSCAFGAATPTLLGKDLVGTVSTATDLGSGGARMMSATAGGSGGGAGLYPSASFPFLGMIPMNGHFSYSGCVAPLLSPTFASSPPLGAGLGFGVAGVTAGNNVMAAWSAIPTSTGFDMAGQAQIRSILAQMTCVEDLLLYARSIKSM